MCQRDDPSCAEFDQHRLAFAVAMGRERRAFLKGGFVAAGGAPAIAAGGTFHGPVSGRDRN